MSLNCNEDVARFYFYASQTESMIITTARFYHALREVEKSANDIRAGLDNKIPGDLLDLDICRYLHYLGEIK